MAERREVVDDVQVTVMAIGGQLEVGLDVAKAIRGDRINADPDTDANTNRWIAIDPPLGEFPVERSKVVIGELLLDQGEASKIAQRPILDLTARAVDGAAYWSRSGVVLRLPQSERETSVGRSVHGESITAGIGRRPVMTLDPDRDTEAFVKVSDKLRPKGLGNEATEMDVSRRIGRCTEILTEMYLQELPIPLVGNLGLGVH